MHRGIKNGWHMAFPLNSKISIKSLFVVKNQIMKENKRK